MKYPDERLDQLLRGLGAEWRASERPFEVFSVAALVRRHGQIQSHTFRSPLVAIASLVAVLVVAVSLLAVYLASPVGPASRTPMPSAIAPASAIATVQASGSAPTPIVTNSPSGAVKSIPAPTTKAAILEAPQVYPVAWSADGTELIVRSDGPDPVMHVFDSGGHEIWRTSALDAAWTGSNSVAYLTILDGSSGTTALNEVTLPSGVPTTVPGSFQNSILGAPNGALAVPTWGDSAGFDLLNPTGGHFAGNPVAWSSDQSKLAILSGPSELEGILEILDLTSLGVTPTKLMVSANGLAFDRTGSQLLACVFANDGECTPSLIRIAAGTVTASDMHGELANPAELPDGRWIGRNLGKIVLWDPQDPTSEVDLESGWPSLSPSGAVLAVLNDAGSPPSSPDNKSDSTGGPAIFKLTGSGISFPVWAPAGDQIAFSVVSGGSQQELVIADVP